MRCIFIHLHHSPWDNLLQYDDLGLRGVLVAMEASNRDIRLALQFLQLLGEIR